MSFSILPDLCIETIFDRIALQEINVLMLVCRRWYLLSLRIYVQRRSLVLLVGTDERRLRSIQNACCCYDDCDYFGNLTFKEKRELSLVTFRKRFGTNLLEYETFDESDIKWLVKSFPNISNLKLLYEDYSFKGFKHVIQLLNQWPQLKSLLFFNTKFNFRDQNLFDSINSMRSLKNLVLDVDYRGDLAQVNFTILSKLQQFTFQTLDPNNDAKKICKLISNSAKNNSAIKIVCGRAIDGLHTLESIYKSGAPLNRFVSLRFDKHFRIEFPQLRLFCLNFTSLRYINLNVGKLCLSQMSECLALLPNLTEFNLCLNADFDSFASENDLPSRYFSSVNSVKALTIDLHSINCHHATLNSVHFATIFPNVQFVSIGMYSFNDNYCYICKLSYHYKLSRRVELEDCINLLALPFKQCPKLERVYFDEECNKVRAKGKFQISWSNQDL